MRRLIALAVLLASIAAQAGNTSGWYEPTGDAMTAGGFMIFLALVAGFAWLSRDEWR
jgi:hypothetical protein